MELDDLRELPLVGGCLSRLVAFAFGTPFLAAGGYLWFAAAGDPRWVELGLGLVALLTGALVVVPWGLGYRKAAKPLAIVWLVSLALVLLAAAVAKILGLV